MVEPKEGMKVWVRHSNCGYRGVGKVLNSLYGSNWLIQALDGTDAVFSAKAEFLDEYKEGQAIPGDLSKEEKKELKKKFKMEKRNHLPTKGRR